MDEVLHATTNQSTIPDVASKSRKSRESDEKADTPSGDRLPRVLAFWVWLIAFGVYLLTLSPGVSWAHHSEDSGDLITSAWVLGIPHPTGYPLFCIFGWLWSHLIPIGTVAWRMNAFSALWGSIAAALTVRAVWTSFSLLSDESSAKVSRFGKGLAALSSGLILAFATDVWSLSIVTEVYSVNLFFVALIGWILIEILAGAKLNRDKNGEGISADWKRRRVRLLLLTGFFWGLALTNHLTSIFLLPGMILVLAWKETRPRGVEIPKMLGVFLLPLLIYLYLPIRSAMNPPLDWGNPESLPNFIWVVTGRQFRVLMFTLLPYQMLNQIVRYASIPTELGGIGAFAAGLGVVRLMLGKNRETVILFIYTLLLVASSFFYLASYYIWDPEGYLLPMVWATALWAGWSIYLLVNLPVGMVQAGKIIAVILLGLAPLGALAGHWQSVDLSGNHEAIRFGEESFASYEENTVVIEMRYERAFTLWYYREVEYADMRDDVAVIYTEHLAFDWGIELMRRLYPDLALPDAPLPGPDRETEAAIWIIKNNIEQRPVYTGAIFEELADEGYTFDAVGLSYRVFPPGTQ